MDTKALEMKALKSIAMCIMLISTLVLVTPVAAARTASANEISNFLSSPKTTQPSVTAAPGAAKPAVQLTQATASPQAAEPQKDISSFFTVRTRATDLLTASPTTNGINTGTGGKTNPKPSYAPAAGPDLVPTSLTEYKWSDVTWGHETNKKVGFRVTVTNAGLSSVPLTRSDGSKMAYSVYVYYKKHDASYDWQFAAKGTIMAEGQTTGSAKTIEFEWKVPMLSPGYYDMKVVADADNDVLEINESNNEKVFSGWIQLNEDQKATISGVIRDAYSNRPLADAWVTTDTGLETMSDKDGAYSFTGLDPDNTYKVTASHEYFADKSASSYISSGQSKTLDIALERNVFADLKVGAEDVEFTKPAIAGQQASVTITVHNIGEAPAEGFQITFNGAESQVAYVGAGGTTKVVSSWVPAESGKHSIDFWLRANSHGYANEYGDYQDVQEQNWDNNYIHFSKDLYVGSTGAVLKSTLGASDTKPKAGNTIVLTGTVTNSEGDGATGPAADIEVTFSRQVLENYFDEATGETKSRWKSIELGTQTIPFIGVGETAKVTAEYAPIEAGDDPIFFEINDFGQDASQTKATATMHLDVQGFTPLPNRAPYANAGPDRVVAVGETVKFNASEGWMGTGKDGWHIGSYDADGKSDIASYIWEISTKGGTPTKLKGEVVSYTFNSNATYAVKLTITDKASQVATDNATVIATYKPVAVISPASKTVYSGEKVTWNVSKSYDSDGSLKKQSFSYGDSATQWESPVYASQSHIYTKGGEFTFTFKVQDNQGIWSDSATSKITVLENRPELSVATIVIGLDPDSGAGSGSQGQTQGQGYTGDGMSGGGGNGQSGSGKQGSGDGAPKDETAYKDVTTRIWAYVSNNGQADASNVKVAFYASVGGNEKLLGSKTLNVPAIGGAYEKASMDWTPLSGGTNVVKVKVDPDNAIPEANEKDNDATKNVDVVGNRIPTAFISGPTDGYTHQTYEFDGSASDDIDGSIVSYYWTFGDETRGSAQAVSTPVVVGGNANLMGNGISVGTPGMKSFNAPRAVTGEAKVTHAYAKSGTYTVTLTVTDDDGDTSVATHEITITNRAPSVTVGNVVTQAYVGESVTFTATGTDPDGDTLTYSWDFSDGSTAQGQTVKHAYDTASNYTYFVTVTDDEDAQAQDQSNIEILPAPGTNNPPVAEAGADQKVRVNTSVSFDGSHSSDSDGTIVSYGWDFGDGDTGTGATPSHTYTAVGTYTVTLKVTDNKDATGTDTLTVKVYDNLLPTANAGADRVVRTNTSVSFSGSGTDSDGTIESYGWDFGDNTTADGQYANHTYTASGKYTVTLTVTDNDGGKGTDTATITVMDNIPPVAEIHVKPRLKVNVNKTMTFDGTASYDTDGSIASYGWDFGDGNTSSDAIAKYNYTVVGNYTVELTVTDNDGGTDKASVDVEIVEADKDVTPPEVTGKSPSGDVVGLTQTLRVTTDEVAFCAYSVDNISYESMTQFASTNSTEHSTVVTAKVGQNTYYVLCRDTAGNTMEEPAVIAFNASEEPSAPPMGGGGGIWNFGGSGTTPKPGQSVIQIPTSPAPTAPQQKATISVPSVAAYESGKLGISRDYYYNPNTNHTIYTLRIENRGNTTLRVSIKDVIPKSFAEHVSEVAIRPKPDTIYKEDPEVGWRALFGPSTMLVISYEFNKYIPLEDIQNLPAPEITLITTPAGAAAAATTTQTTATPLTGVTALVVGALNNPVSGISAVIFIALACLLYARGRDVETAIRSLKPSRPLRRHARNYAKVAVAAAVFLGIVLALAQVVVFGTMLVVLAALLATATWRGKELQVALRAIPPGVRAWCAAAAARVRKSIVVRKLAAFWRWFLATRVGMALKRFTAWLGRGYGRVKASWFGRALGKARAKTVAGWRWLKASRLGRGAGWLKARIASAGHTLKAWIMGAPEIVAEEVARTERIFELVREVPAQAGEGW